MNIASSKKYVDIHRKRMRSLGYKILSTWIIDTNNKNFLEKIKQECATLRGSKEEKEILEFNLEAISYIEGWKE